MNVHACMCMFINALHALFSCNDWHVQILTCRGYTNICT